MSVCQFVSVCVCRNHYNSESIRPIKLKVWQYKCINFQKNSNCCIQNDGNSGDMDETLIHGGFRGR